MCPGQCWGRGEGGEAWSLEPRGTLSTLQAEEETAEPLSDPGRTWTRPASWTRSTQGGAAAGAGAAQGSPAAPGTRIFPRRRAGGRAEPRSGQVQGRVPEGCRLRGVAGQGRAPSEGGCGVGLCPHEIRSWPGGRGRPPQVSPGPSEGKKAELLGTPAPSSGLLCAEREQVLPPPRGGTARVTGPRQRAVPADLMQWLVVCCR